MYADEPRAALWILNSGAIHALTRAYKVIHANRVISLPAHHDPWAQSSPASVSQSCSYLLEPASHESHSRQGQGLMTATARDSNWQSLPACMENSNLGKMQGSSRLRAVATGCSRLICVAGNDRVHQCSTALTMPRGRTGTTVGEQLHTFLQDKKRTQWFSTHVALTPGSVPKAL